MWSVLQTELLEFEFYCFVGLGRYSVNERVFAGSITHEKMFLASVGEKVSVNDLQWILGDVSG